MKKSLPQTAPSGLAHHWYDPLVRAEHKTAEFISHEVDDTFKGCSRWERSIARYSRQHPTLVLSCKTVMLVLFVLGLLLSQAYHSRLGG